MGPILLKPQSRGTITLRSADPKDKPLIDPRYLTDPAGADREALMAGLRMCATIARGARAAGHHRQDRPAAGCDDASTTKRSTGR